MIQNIQKDKEELYDLLEAHIKTIKLTVRLIDMRSERYRFNSYSIQAWGVHALFACLLICCGISRGVSSLFFCALYAIILLLIWQSITTATSYYSLLFAFIIEIGISVVSVYFIKQSIVHDLPESLFWLCNGGIMALFAWYTIDKNKNRKIFTLEHKSIAAPCTDESVSSIVNTLTEKVKQCNDSNLLMNDYTTDISFTYRDRINKLKTEQKLKLLLDDILHYLNLPQTVALKIAYIDEENPKNTTETAGEYQSNTLIRVITIKIKEIYGPNNIVAILCHECAHYYMELHKLNLSDTSANEIRTDYLTNIIGFGRIMIEGYKEVHKSKTEGNMTIHSTHKIGYISSEDCVEVRKALVTYRTNAAQNDLNAQKVSEMKGKCKSYLETALVLDQQLKLRIQEAKERNYPKESFQVIQIQYVIEKFESINIPEKVSQIKATVTKSNDVKQINDSYDEITMICSHLSEWLKSLEG